MEANFARTCGHYSAKQPIFLQAQCENSYLNYKMGNGDTIIKSKIPRDLCISKRPIYPSAPIIMFFGAVKSRKIVPLSLANEADLLGIILTRAGQLKDFMNPIIDSVTV
jgi:hypothetical protein